MVFRNWLQVESLAITFFHICQIRHQKQIILKFSNYQSDRHLGEEWTVLEKHQSVLALKGTVFAHCRSSWTMSPTLLEVVCTFAGHSLPLCGSCTTNRFKKVCLLLTYNAVQCKANRLDPFFPREESPCTKLTFSGSDHLGQCFSNFIVHIHHLLLVKWRFWFCKSGAWGWDSAFPSSAQVPPL